MSLINLTLNERVTALRVDGNLQVRLHWNGGRYTLPFCGPTQICRLLVHPPIPLVTLPTFHNGSLWLPVLLLFSFAKGEPVTDGSPKTTTILRRGNKTKDAQVGILSTICKVSRKWVDRDEVTVGCRSTRGRRYPSAHVYLESLRDARTFDANGKRKTKREPRYEPCECATGERKTLPPTTETWSGGVSSYRDKYTLHCRCKTV